MGEYEDRVRELESLIGQLEHLEKLPYEILQHEKRVTKTVTAEAKRLDDRISRLEGELALRARALDAREEAIHQLVREKTTGFPWLAEAYDEFLRWQDDLTLDLLRAKDRPAPQAADAVREMSGARRRGEKRAKILEYKLNYYESLFPWLEDLTGEDVDDLLIAVTEGDREEGEEPEDPAKHWLTDAEYANLSPGEKFQVSLDRYWNRRKRPWEIGRDYERYVGYLYEKRGANVYYQGIVEGFEDLGRDLVASTDGSVEIVQCKNWSKTKTIHEKHIFQLFGTVTAYRIDHSDESASGTFCTSTSLSDRAKQFADMLEIKYVENFPLERYPCVKCNVSMRGQEKIFHLPFDQQYDRTIIEEERLERYVETVAEAEALGFRRAFRWRGGRQSDAPP